MASVREVDSRAERKALDDNRVDEVSIEDEDIGGVLLQMVMVCEFGSSTKDKRKSYRQT